MTTTWPSSRKSELVGRTYQDIHLTMHADSRTDEKARKELAAKAGEESSRLSLEALKSVGLEC